LLDSLLQEINVTFRFQSVQCSTNLVKRPCRVQKMSRSTSVVEWRMKVIKMLLIASQVPPAILNPSITMETLEDDPTETTEITINYPLDNLVQWKPLPLLNLKERKVMLPGEMGSAVDIPDNRKEEVEKMFPINQFNLVASEMISLNRSLTDARHQHCIKDKYPAILPPTSVIIVFHNEAWSTLLRSIHSVISRSPLSLLTEIILVDDASEHTHLGTQLEEYVTGLPVLVKVLRSKTRIGLIRARLLGADNASGPVLTFLDSHVECNHGWLQPLLAEVMKDRAIVVSPVIDVISEDTFKYISVEDISIGGLDWNLNFLWFRREKQADMSKPLPTPTMAGGLFSVDKEFFYSIGSYDEGMDVWGAENLEMSFRTWMCGGKIHIHPCSRVGHVFRKQSPYTFPGGTEKVLNINKVRLAEVWMDQWKSFYTANTPSSKLVNPGNMTSRKQLRENLRCQSFRWYLENIYPESPYPLDYHYLGEVIHMNKWLCLDTLNNHATEELGVSPCHGHGGPQVWVYTGKHEFRSGDVCLDAVGDDEKVKLWSCHGLGGNQEWLVTEEGNIHHRVSGQCLVVGENDDLGLGQCGLDQRWNLKSNQ